MGDLSNVFEVEDRSRTGDCMAGTGQECANFIILCRGISADRAIHLVTMARLYGSLDLPELEVFIRRVRD